MRMDGMTNLASSLGVERLDVERRREGLLGPAAGRGVAAASADDMMVIGKEKATSYSRHPRGLAYMCLELRISVLCLCHEHGTARGEISRADLM